MSTLREDRYLTDFVRLILIIHGLCNNGQMDTTPGCVMFTKLMRKNETSKVIELSFKEWYPFKLDSRIEKPKLNIDSVACFSACWKSDTEGPFHYTKCEGVSRCEGNVKSSPSGSVHQRNFPINFLKKSNSNCKWKNHDDLFWFVRC